MRLVGSVLLSGSVAMASVGLSGPDAKALHLGSPSPEEAREIAAEAYVYGYPLVTMEATRRVMTNVPADDGRRAPMGQLARMRSFPTAADREVTAPSADMLTTSAWVDLSGEPYVLSLPDMRDRYVLFSVLDAWTNVASNPGTRTTGTAPQKLVLTGPGWRGGGLPTDATRVTISTATAWIVGLISSTGSPQDLDAVRALQDQISLVPLSAYGKPYAPPPGRVNADVDMTTPVRQQVDTLDVVAFFRQMAELMTKDPPSGQDKDVLDRMGRIGLVPGKPFDPRKLPPKVAASLGSAPSDARQELEAEARSAPVKESGWRVVTRTGDWGTDYPLRALVAAVALGSNLATDEVCPVAVEDESGAPLDGARSYVVHLAKAQMPARGPWSLTMYDERMFFTESALQRHALPAGELAANADGSVDLLIQPDSPGADRESNWLPSRPGRIVLMFRLYWPNQRPPSLFDGSWKPPPVRRARPE